MKANVSKYDISSLLYLSTVGIDFEAVSLTLTPTITPIPTMILIRSYYNPKGGHFAFNDQDQDRLIEPKAGRLVAFDSGSKNLHQVRPVISGYHD